MADEQVTCPECGEQIDSEDDVESEEVRVITGGLTYGDQSRNLFMCKKCKKVLGVSADA